MKRALFAATILSMAVTAWAQDKPAGQGAEKTATEAVKPVASNSTKPAVVRKSRRNQDARGCLDKPTNFEIAKCAEAYL